LLASAIARLIDYCLENIFNYQKQVAMMKHMVNNNRLAKGIVLASIMMAVTLPVSASKNKVQSPDSQAPAIEVVSANDAATSIQVQLENPDAKTFTVIIRDEVGNALFRKDFNDASFSKVFKVLNPAEGSKNLTVSVSFNGDKDFSYEVNNSVSLVSDFHIIKL
jgi:hypothetical protein